MQGDTATPTNRIDIPLAVRQNLGITFATVERRAVTTTLRLPGRFEPTPDARRDHVARLDGTVEILVQELEVVEPGTPLFRVDSPTWRELQRELADADSALLVVEASLASMPALHAAHEQHERGLAARVEVLRTWLAELETLARAGAARREQLSEARAELAEAESLLGEVLEKDAELEVRRRELDVQRQAATGRMSLLLDQASALAGIDSAALRRAAPTADGGSAPLWRTLQRLEIRAVEAGVVEHRMVAEGAGVTASSVVLVTIRPERMRFRAAVPQGDVGRIRDGMAATIVPASAAPGDASESSISTTVALAPVIDAARRTIDLFAPAAPRSWARPGATGFIEIDVGGGEVEPAIPLACVIRDGTARVIFRRDPRQPDVAIRIDADLGPDDGRWVAIRSGVRPGDEIVLGGARQLMLATSGSAPRGGHFHADGTFHEGDH